MAGVSGSSAPGRDDPHVVPPLSDRDAAGGAGTGSGTAARTGSGSSSLAGVGGNGFGTNSMAGRGIGGLACDASGPDGAAGDCRSATLPADETAFSDCDFSMSGTPRPASTARLETGEATLGTIAGGSIGWSFTLNEASGSGGVSL